MSSSFQPFSPEPSPPLPIRGAPKPKKTERRIERMEEDYIMNCVFCGKRRGHTWNCSFFEWKNEDIIHEEREAHCDAFHQKLMNRNCYCGFRGVIVPKDWQPQELSREEKRKREETSLHADAVRFINRGESFLYRSERALKLFQETLDDFKKFLEEEKADLTDEEEI